MIEKIRNKFDLSIALTLSTWPALTLAVQNSWGGPESSEKRDWFAGAISDLLDSTSDADVEYVEEFLLQVMNDEFDVNIEDGSGEEIAAKIVGLRKLTLSGDFALVDEMYTKWQERQTKGEGAIKFQKVDSKEYEDDTDEDSIDMEEGSIDEDVEMGQSRTIVRPSQEKNLPVIDDDGFIEVIGKKKR